MVDSTSWAGRPGGGKGTGKGRGGVSARGPSRPRPWLAVAVAETAGDVRSGGDRPRERHGFVTGEGRIRHRRPAESQRPWEVHASVRVGQQSRPRLKPCGRYGTTKLQSRFSAL